MCSSRSHVAFFVIAFSTIAVNLYTLAISGSNNSRTELRVFVKASCRMLGTENNYNHLQQKRVYIFFSFIQYRSSLTVVCALTIVDPFAAALTISVKQADSSDYAHQLHQLFLFIPFRQTYVIRQFGNVQDAPQRQRNLSNVKYILWYY